MPNSSKAASKHGIATFVYELATIYCGFIKTPSHYHQPLLTNITVGRELFECVENYGDKKLKSYAQQCLDQLPEPTIAKVL